MTLLSYGLVLLKEHFGALLLALLIGIIYVGPIFYQAHTPGYRGIYMSEATDEALYMATINKSYVSNGIVGNPFLYEYQNTRNPFQYYPIEFALGKTGAALHLSIDKLAEAMDFVFPFLLTLLVYTFVWWISQNKIAALLASAMVLFGSEAPLFSNVHDGIRILLFNGPTKEFMQYARPVNPQESIFLFFGALMTIYALLKYPRWTSAMATGILLGLLAYVYFYFWAFIFALLGVVALYSLSARRFDLTAYVTLATALGLFICAPFLSALFHVLNGSVHVSNATAVSTHRFIAEKIVLVPLIIYACVYLFTWWKKRNGSVSPRLREFTEKYLIIVLLLCTCVLVSNQQILTGRLLQQFHFHFGTNMPIVLIATAILISEGLMFTSRKWRLTGVALVVLGVAWLGIGVEVSTYKNHAVEYDRDQYLAPVFAYLRNDAPAQSVVLTSGHLATQMAMYTQDFSYYDGYDAIYQTPEERLTHNYFVRLAMRGVTKNTVRDYMSQPQNRDELGTALYVEEWRDLCGSHGCFPDSVIENLVPPYDAFLSRPLLENLKKYKIDYVLWDKENDPDWKHQVQEIVAEPPLVTSGGFSLYKVK